jgi:PAS domain S-box-containing protein
MEIGWPGRLVWVTDGTAPALALTCGALARPVWSPLRHKPLMMDQRPRADREDDPAAPYLSAIVAASDDALIGTALDGTIVVWNEAAERLYGYAAEEALGRRASLLMAPSDGDELSDQLEHIRRGERITHYGAPRQRKDGALIRVSLGITPVRDAGGRVVGSATNARALAEDGGSGASEVARYARSLIELSHNPLLTLSPAGKITAVNTATEEANGVAREQLIGTDFADCFAEPEKARAAYQRVLEEGLLSDYPLVLRHVSGALTNVAYSATVYRDESGELQAVFAAARDPAEAQQARLQVARLAALAAASQNATFTRDLGGTITSWNAAAERLYGYAAREAIGRSGTILMPPGREAETQELIRRMLRGKRGFGCETQRQHKDGSLLDVALATSPLRDAAGEIVGITIIAHDISERVRAERQLRESEAKLAAAFHASPDLMAITRLTDGTLLEVNESFTQLLGYGREEALGRTVAELSVWADSAYRAYFVACLAESGQVSDFETTLQRKDGSRVACSTSARTIELQGETCVLSVIRDIGERKRAEEALRESEAHLRTLIDTIPDLVWLKDPEGTYLSCNRRFESFFGAPVCDILGKTDYDFTNADQADAFRQHDLAAMTAAVPTANEEEIVFAADGHHEVLETIKTPVHDSDGRLIGILGVGRDITERKQAEEEVRLHAEQLQRTVEGAVLAMSRMVESRDPYTAGHERRVAELATAIGAEMGMAGAELDALRLAGTIHDLGKIAVPAEILAKPGRLSEMEFNLIKAHPTIGSEILADVDFGSPVAEIVLQHHERLDGSGYPRGLRGDEVLPGARILAVADVVEAMSSHRPYRAALGIEAALTEVREHAGVTFDAKVVAACVLLLEERDFQFAP